MSVSRASPSTWDVPITAMGSGGVYEVKMPPPRRPPAPPVINEALNEALSKATPSKGDRGFILFDELSRRYRVSVERWIRGNASNRFELQGTSQIKVGPGGKVIPYVALSLAIFFGLSRLDSLLGRSHA